MIETIFRDIAGCVLFILGTTIMLYLSWYAGLVWKQEAPPSLIKGLWLNFGFWLIFFSMRLFGATVAFSAFITILTFLVCLYISDVWYKGTASLIDSIVITGLYILAAIVLVVAYWWFKQEGGETFLEAIFKKRG